MLCDMEGISGIRTIDQVKRDSPEYAEGRRLMMADINAAVAACYEGGADQVVVCDTHGGGGQLQLEAMDARPLYETPNAGAGMPALDATFDGVILLGHHARAGTLNAFLDHTMDSSAWFEYRINGLTVGEIGIEAAWAGHYNVPVILVSGDAATAAEASELLPGVECAVVKWGVGRNRARCLSLAAAYAEIRRAVLAALASVGTRQPWKPALPATIRLTLYRSDYADDLARRPGAVRVDARTIQRTVTSALDICRW
jgi:D-amino peptidase